MCTHPGGSVPSLWRPSLPARAPQVSGDRLPCSRRSGSSRPTRRGSTGSSAEIPYAWWPSTVHWPAGPSSTSAPGRCSSPRRSPVPAPGTSRSTPTRPSWPPRPAGSPRGGERLPFRRPVGRRLLLLQRRRARARALAVRRRDGPGDPARRPGRRLVHELAVALGRARDLAVALPRRLPRRRERYAPPLRPPAQEPVRRRALPGLGRGRAALGHQPAGRRAGRRAAALPAGAAPAGCCGCPGCARSRPGTSGWCCGADDRHRCPTQCRAWSGGSGSRPLPWPSWRSPSARRRAS